MNKEVTARVQDRSGLWRLLAKEEVRAQACASFIYPEIRVRNRFSTG